jgi:hypothetical protein
MVISSSTEAIPFICWHPDLISIVTEYRPAFLTRIEPGNPQIPGSIITCTSFSFSVDSFTEYFPGLLFHVIGAGDFLCLHLIEDLIGYEPYQMREFIRHMGNLHGFHELLLEIAFHGQLDVFHIS